MKGLKIIRAEPSNAIDVYALLKEWAKENKGKDFLFEIPSEKKLQYYFFARLIPELQSPLNMFFLARRGRGFLGMLHAMLVPGRWDGQIDSIFIDKVYVVPGRRKMGVGRRLLDELKKEAENMGIKRIELLADDELKAYWAKHGAAQKSNFMRVDL